MKILSLVLLVTLTTGCLTRAPSDYELDRRSGLTPPNDTTKRNQAELSKFNLLKARTLKPSRDPARSAPRVEKVWVYDQVMGNRVLQGTWMFVEVNKGGWETASVESEQPKPEKHAAQTLSKDGK